MILALAVACTLSFHAPSAETRPRSSQNPCLGDSARPACIASFRVYGQAQWGRRDTLIYESPFGSAPGSRVTLAFDLPDPRCWVVDVRAVSCDGVEGCESNLALVNEAGFVYPPWRPR